MGILNHGQDGSSIGQAGQHGTGQGDAIIGRRRGKIICLGAMQKLAPRCQRDRHRKRLARAPDERDLLGQRRARGPHERCLADPSLAGDQHDAPAASDRVLDRRSEQSELIPALEQAHHVRDRNVQRALPRRHTSAKPIGAGD